MEWRQLEAFVAVATEPHFGLAAQKLFIGQPTLSDLIRRLERELGTPLLIRTTRRVTLTEAGPELLRHAKIILDEVDAATASVHRIAHGEGGTVRVGMTRRSHRCWPPTRPRPSPHRRPGSSSSGPGSGSPASSRPSRTGPSTSRAPAGSSTNPTAWPPRCSAPNRSWWACDPAQRQALAAAGVDPPRTQLAPTDLAATSWQDQPDIDWIMLTGSLAAGHGSTVVCQLDPPHDVPFTLQWNPGRTRSPAVARFAEHALTTGPPPGWAAGSDHRGHVPGGPDQRPVP